MKPVRSHRRARSAGLAIGLAIVFVVTLPPFVGERWASGIMAAFSSVCHQLPDRSPHWNGTSLAVCFRCYGIYWGLPLAAALFPLVHRRLARLDRWAPFVLAGSLVPAAIDWSLEVAGIVPGSQAVRFVTGLLFGCAAGYYLVVAIGRSADRTRAQAM